MLYQVYEYMIYHRYTYIYVYSYVWHINMWHIYDVTIYHDVLYISYVIYMSHIWMYNNYNYEVLVCEHWILPHNFNPGLWFHSIMEENNLLWKISSYPSSNQLCIFVTTEHLVKSEIELFTFFIHSILIYAFSCFLLLI